MSYKGILLDIDNTIYDYDKVHKNAIKLTLEFISNILKIEYETVEKAYKKSRESINMELRNTAASHNRLLYFQRTVEALSTRDYKIAYEAYTKYWDEVIENMCYFEDFVDFLDVIKNKKICLLTDLTADIQFRKILKLGLLKYNPTIVTSEEAGIEKPHPYMFLLALKKLGLKPNEVCVIGDNYLKDIKGALNLGIDAFWFNKNKEEMLIDEKVKSYSNYKEAMRWFSE